MSYDLLVFDAASAPEERAEFLAWFHEQTSWQETHRYDDPIVTTPALRAWFTAMAAKFPPMNGPLASDDGGDATVTDYSLGKHVVYAAFAWSVAERARATTLALAKEHRVGFFDVSADAGEIWRP